jgi:hypothetical protein
MHQQHIALPERHIRVARGEHRLPRESSVSFDGAASASDIPGESAVLVTMTRTRVYSNRHP